MGIPSEVTCQGLSLKERAATRAAERRKRFWWSVASWATTILTVLVVGAIVHWRITTVLGEDRRERQAEADFREALRSQRAAPGDLAAAAARFRAIIANYPGTPAAHRAHEELEKLERPNAGKVGNTPDESARPK